MADELILAAARAVRPYLERLVGADAAHIDAQIVRLLRSADPDEATEDLADLFETREGLHVWVASFLETGLPPAVVGARERAIEPGFDGLRGDGVPVVFRCYACPVDGLYVWYRLDVADEVPDCPDHPGTRLKRLP